MSVERPALIPYLENVLADLHKTLVQRGSSYADFADNSRVFTELMAALGIKKPDGMSQVSFHGQAMICTKLARDATGDRTHEDTWVDIANYAVLILADLRRTKSMQVQLQAEPSRDRMPTHHVAGTPRQ